jgi:hypothetical protein
VIKSSPQSKNPRYLGGFDEFDIYITGAGSIIARYGNGYGDFVNIGSRPYVKGKARLRLANSVLVRSPDLPERIKAMIMCFAPDVCAE